MNEDEYAELKMDRVQEHQQELYYEKRMYDDHEYCLSELLPDVIESIKHLHNTLLSYGHSIDEQELCDEIKETL